MNIAEVLQQQALARPDAPAIADVRHGRERSFSLGQLDERTARLAGLLRRDGIQRGDGVLILHPMATELYVFLIAVFRVGATALFVDPSAGMEHVAQCCALWPMKAFFGSPKAHLLRLKSSAIRNIPLQYSTSWLPGATDISKLEQLRNDERIDEVDDTVPALITFTSGSTGTPKAAVRTHNFLLAQHRALATSLKLSLGDVDLTTLPVFVLANLASGVVSVLPNADISRPGRYTAAPVLEQIRKHQVTSTAASPAFLNGLITECESTGRNLASFRKVFIGGAPVFPGLLRRARTVFRNAVIMAVYGSTEAEPMAEIAMDAIIDDDFRRMAEGGGLLAGKPVETIELAVVQDRWGTPMGRLSTAEFNSLKLAPNAPGEIVVSGEHVIGGYLEGHGDAENKFEVEGKRWHRTGDLGYMDDSGRLWLLGRCSAKIHDERGVLYPFAMECAAQQDASVARAALVAIAGERVLAVEVKRGHGHNPDHLLQQLSWANLDRVEYVKNIPVDTRHNSKVDYTKLQALVRQTGKSVARSGT